METFANELMHFLKPSSASGRMPRMVLPSQAANATIMRLGLILPFFLVVSTFGHAQATTFQHAGSESAPEDGCFELISSETETAGAVWAMEAIDLTQPFHLQAVVNFGTIDHGAEGVVLVFQGQGPDVVGQNFSDFDVSFGVEMDTRQQPELGDIDADHIALLTDGSYQHIESEGTLVAGPVSAFVDGSNLDDGEDHVMELVWNPNGPELTVHLDCVERMVASVDLVDDVFEGQPLVWWGFVADTTDAQNAERVCLQSNATGTDTEVYGCPESAVQLVAGGLNVEEYTWSPGNVVSNPTIGQPTYTGVAGETLTVTYANHCGEMITDQVNVIVKEVVANISSEQGALNCYNGGVLACEAETPFGNALDYTWTLNNVTIGNGPSVVLSEPGSLGLSVTYPGTTSLLCQDEDVMAVQFDTTSLEISAGLPGAITCNNASLELQGFISNNEVAIVEWATLDGTLEGVTNLPYATATSGGTYTMTVTHAENGCVSVDQVVVTEDIEQPEITIGYADGMLNCASPEVQVVSTEIYPEEYTPLLTWTHRESGQTVSNDLEPFMSEAGVYDLHVEFLENGCEATTLYSIEVESDSEVMDLSQMVLPNVITPDNNGNNDRFMPFIPGEDVNVLTSLDEYHIQVFNRWGTLLFQNDGQPIQWDARANGALVDPGAYVVAVQYVANCGVEEQRGTLSTTLEVIR